MAAPQPMLINGVMYVPMVPAAPMGMPMPQQMPMPIGMPAPQQPQMPQPMAQAPGSNWAQVTRREIIGKLGPDPADFHLRHFEVGPGGFSSFEQHQHIHAVIVESGLGEVRTTGTGSMPSRTIL